MVGAIITVAANAIWHAPVRRDYGAEVSLDSCLTDHRQKESQICYRGGDAIKLRPRDR
jgi:hypothetical protein